MNTCERMGERISALVDGELQGREKLEVMEHLSRCPRCRAVFEDYTAMGEAMAADTVSAPAGFADAVMARVAATPQEAKKPAAPPWRRWAVTAACFALAFAGLWAVQGQEKPAAPETALYAADDAKAAVPRMAAETESTFSLTTAAPAAEEGCTLPGDTAPRLMWEGAVYTWAAVAEEVPAGYEAVGELEQAGELTSDGQFAADFAAAGTIYDDPDTAHSLYVRITTDWLEAAVVRFDRAE